MLTNIGLGPITISEETKELLKDRLKADTMLGGDVQRAMMTGAVARGIEAAGSNENGAMMGFMGMNMAMNAGNNVTCVHSHVHTHKAHPRRMEMLMRRYKHRCFLFFLRR